MSWRLPAHPFCHRIRINEISAFLIRKIAITRPYLDNHLPQAWRGGSSASKIDVPISKFNFGARLDPWVQVEQVFRSYMQTRFLQN